VRRSFGAGGIGVFGNGKVICTEKVLFGWVLEWAQAGIDDCYFDTPNIYCDNTCIQDDREIVYRKQHSVHGEHDLGNHEFIQKLQL
jgi:hypothetical protein